MAQITEEDRLRLENEALSRIVQHFASLPTNCATYKAEGIQVIVEKARNILGEVKRRRKRLNPTGDVERLSAVLVEEARRRGVQDPCVVLERLGRASWEAYLGDLDDDLGIAQGATAFEAVNELLRLVRSCPRILAELNQSSA
jgi:ribose 1,5-bisphosphokinase PhnN